MLGRLGNPSIALAGEAPSSLGSSERTEKSPFQEADRHKSQGYIHSKSIMKLVLALKAKAMPLRSLTRPTSVLWRRGKRPCFISSASQSPSKPTLLAGPRRTLPSPLISENGFLGDQQGWPSGLPYGLEEPAIQTAPALWAFRKPLTQTFWTSTLTEEGNCPLLSLGGSRRPSSEPQRG